MNVESVIKEKVVADSILPAKVIDILKIPEKREKKSGFSFFLLRITVFCDKSNNSNSSNFTLKKSYGKRFEGIILPEKE
jgi:hypothetical protein